MRCHIPPCLHVYAVVSAYVFIYLCIFTYIFISFRLFAILSKLLNYWEQ